MSRGRSIGEADVIDVRIGEALLHGYVVPSNGQYRRVHYRDSGSWEITEGIPDFDVEPLEVVA